MLYMKEISLKGDKLLCLFNLFDKLQILKTKSIACMFFFNWTFCILNSEYHQLFILIHFNVFFDLGFAGNCVLQLCYISFVLCWSYAGCYQQDSLGDEGISRYNSSWVPVCCRKYLYWTSKWQFHNFLWKLSCNKINLLFIFLTL